MTKKNPIFLSLKQIEEAYEYFKTQMPGKWGYYKFTEYFIDDGTIILPVDSRRLDKEMKKVKTKSDLEVTITIKNVKRI